ncbi:MAG: bifunctional DNA-formamidopyrimidine glycosylase/DNA-(apurinic or apyrimidinic site) lyase [Pyrinomonadaceae bacterium]
MPELPEVETISRSLDTLVKGRMIVTAELVRQRLAPETKAKDFAKILKSKHINFIHRRGKHILFDLSDDRTLIVHLRMSGRFSLLPDERENPKFTHAIFQLDGDDRLVFDDQRHFGLMKIVKTSELHEAKELKKLAPEPFSDEFSVDYFHRVLKSSKRSLKEVLLDQTKVCGVGNIYASEAMFAAGLHPAIASNKVSKPKAERLHASVRGVLQIAIDHASLKPIDPENLEGNYYSAADAPSWLVYDRENEPCRNCNSPIVRLKQGGRSTYFCRKCQRR